MRTSSTTKFLALAVLALTARLWAASPATPATAPATLPAADPTLGKGKVICEDAFYNEEKNGTGFHYHWDDTANPGYSKFGEIWKQNGPLTLCQKAADHGSDPRRSRQMLRLYDCQPQPSF